MDFREARRGAAQDGNAGQALPCDWGNVRHTGALGPLRGPAWLPYKERRENI